MSTPSSETRAARVGASLRWLMPAGHEPWWLRGLVGIACGLVAFAARLPFEGILQGSLPYIFIFPAITLAAVRGGVVGSVSAVLVTVVSFVATSTVMQGDRAGRLLSLGLFLCACALITAVAVELRRAVAQLQAQELALQASDARLRLLVRELEHRVKNSLALAGSMVNLTARHSDDLADFRARFEPRLQALAGAQAVLTQADWSEPDLGALVRDALAPFSDPARQGVTIEPGPAFPVPITSAVSLAVLLHELATNAMKHGALSAPEGGVLVTWQVIEHAPMAALEWTETGGPKVRKPQRSGFGSELFRALDSGPIHIVRRFDPQGVSCRIELRPE